MELIIKGQILRIYSKYNVYPLYFNSEFLNYAQELWKLELDIHKNCLLIEHEKGVSIYKWEEYNRFISLGSELLNVPHLITPFTPIGLLLEPKPVKIKTTGVNTAYEVPSV